MPERKTRETEASVDAFIRTVANETRRNDSLIVADLMERASGVKAKMWGTSIVGCGKHHYAYANGQRAEICKIGFAPRARSLVFYLAAFDGKAELLDRLGKHQVRGSCLHIARLADVDLDVLGDILRRAFLHDADETSA